jgi:hypothetical protein
VQGSLLSKLGCSTPLATIIGPSDHNSRERTEEGLGLQVGGPSSVALEEGCLRARPECEEGRFEGAVDKQSKALSC